MTAEMILLYGVVAKGGIDLLQLGLIGWGLRRWGKDMDKRREENERKWAERQVVLDEQAARWAEIRQGLGEAIAASQARRAGPG